MTIFTLKTTIKDEAGLDERIDEIATKFQYKRTGEKLTCAGDLEAKKLCNKLEAEYGTPKVEKGIEDLKVSFEGDEVVDADGSEAMIGVADIKDLVDFEIKKVTDE